MTHRDVLLLPPRRGLAPHDPLPGKGFVSLAPMGGGGPRGPGGGFGVPAPESRAAPPCPLVARGLAPVRGVL